VVTAGSNQLLHLVSDSLCDPGDIVLCAAPTYLVYLGTLQNSGARAIGVACDAEGIVPEALEERLRQLQAAGLLPRVKAIYGVSYFDNPRGVTMSAARRGEIVELARRWSVHGTLYVIEDAAYRQLRYGCADVPSMHRFDEGGEQIVLAGTFSKNYSPGIRVGWGILPSRLVAPVCNQKGNIDFGSPNFSQHLMAEVLQRGLFQLHVARIRAAYRQKRDALVEAARRLLAPLREVRWIEPEGGLYVWLELPESIDTGPSGNLLDRALAEGVLYVPGEYCYPGEGEPMRRSTMRLSFGVQSCEKIQLGIEALARAIRSALDAA
jgi:2-aminoadipate transaminase